MHSSNVFILICSHIGGGGTNDYSNDITCSLRNHRRKLIKSTAWCSTICTELSDLPKDGRPTQNDTCFTVYSFHVKTNGANFNRYNRSLTFRYGIQIHYCYHWHFLAICWVIPQTGRNSNSRCRCFMATYLPIYGTAGAGHWLRITFFNDILTHFHQETVIKYYTTIPLLQGG